MAADETTPLIRFGKATLVDEDRSALAEPVDCDAWLNRAGGLCFGQTIEFAPANAYGYDAAIRFDTVPESDAWMVSNLANFTTGSRHNIAPGDVVTIHPGPR